MAKKGFSLGGMLDAVKAELMEDDGKGDAGKAAEKATTAATPPPASMAMPGAPEPVDPKVLEMVTSGVFVDIMDGTKARPSRYMLFSKMWETLGRPADANVPLNAMKVTDPSMTGGAVLQDIDAHIELLNGVSSSAEAEYDGIAAQKLGTADQRLNEIQKANEAALREIERHQKEIGERSAEAAALQAQRTQDEASITRAKAKVAAAVETVRTQLTGARNLFASLS